MKRGQSGLAVIIGLGIIAAIMIIVAFVVKPGVTTTGQALYVPEEGLPEEPEQFSNFIPYPFELRAWTVNENGVKFEVKNIGEESYLVKVLEIDGCGTENQDKLIGAGSNQLLSVSCSLKRGSDFDTSFSFAYVSVSSGEAHLIRGRIRDVV